MEIIVTSIKVMHIINISHDYRDMVKNGASVRRMFKLQ